MARLDELMPGTDFFLVQYYDGNLLVPHIKTLRYEGRQTADDGTELWVFREPRTELPPSDEEARIAEDRLEETDTPLIGFSESTLCRLLNFDGLLAVMNELQAVRPRPGRSAENMTPEQVLEQHSLRERITEFLASSAPARLHLQVRYTDSGLFLTKEAAGLEIRLYTRPLRAPEEDARLLAIMKDAGLPAHTNYFADRGRTRILAYRVPTELAALSMLSARILAVGYEMRTTDELQFRA
jgi:hypothetical protein